MLNYICLIYLSVVSAIPIIETVNNDHSEMIVDKVLEGLSIHTDEYGCAISCGYEWCPSLDMCIRSWETYCKELQFPYNALWKGSGIIVPD